MERRVVVVVFDGFLLLDVAGPLGALEVAGYYVEDGYAIELTSVSGGIVRSSAGVTVETVPFVAGLPVDLMIVPGGPGSVEAAAAKPVLALILEVSSHARRSASVCSGAFLVAAAGILNGKRATSSTPIHSPGRRGGRQKRPEGSPREAACIRRTETKWRTPRSGVAGTGPGRGVRLLVDGNPTSETRDGSHSLDPVGSASTQPSPGSAIWRTHRGSPH